MSKHEGVLYRTHTKDAELFFTFKNIAVSLLAGNAAHYTQEPEAWIMDTQLMSELLHTEAVRFALAEEVYATEQKGTENQGSDGEVLREGEG